MVWAAAGEAGLRGIFSSAESYIEDDHIPFLDVGNRLRSISSI